MLAFRADLGSFYERAAEAGHADPKALANWVVGELVANIGDSDPADTELDPGALAALVAMVGEGAVAGSAAKEVLATLVAEGGDPARIVEDKGLGAAGTDELAGIVEQAMAEQAEAVEKIRAGNDKAIGAVMGVVMRATKGRADGAEVQRLIRERL